METETKTTVKNERKKSWGMLIAGAILLIAGILFTVNAYNTTYQKSLPIAAQISEIKEQLAAAEDGAEQVDTEALNAEKSQLSDEKLQLERPYSFGLTACFLAVLLLARGFYAAFFGVATSRKTDIQRLAQAGLLAALSYVGFAFFKIDIPLGHTAFHFGNVFCVLAALLLGGYWGGLAGAVGLTVADLTTAYVTSAPKTFLLKLCIGLIVGLIAHNLFRLSRSHSAKFVTGVTILASACGMIFNIIADPLVGYFYKTWLLGIPQDLAATLAKLDLLTTSVNAVVAVVAASVFYLALRPALRKAGLLVQVTPE